jgi:hypothetical protein
MLSRGGKGLSESLLKREGPGVQKVRRSTGQTGYAEILAEAIVKWLHPLEKLKNSKSEGSAQAQGMALLGSLSDHVLSILQCMKWSR